MSPVVFALVVTVVSADDVLAAIVASVVSFVCDVDVSFMVGVLVVTVVAVDSELVAIFASVISSVVDDNKLLVDVNCASVDEELFTLIDSYVTFDVNVVMSLVVGVFVVVVINVSVDV